ncbi:hypothetical protein HPB47_010943 [Ixodes persulcatus]|uniref:Uncharacterized protein n=1 Tax=Ixodes persulcatus TaxID=34615 RepID=A0AC60NXS7_IXOPE|nr:hypothetical protein HPB47_010943 [Ixodes persulcatus]
MARMAASMSFAPVSDARKVTEKKAAADAQRQEEAAQKAAEAAVYDDQSKCFQLLELVQRTTLGCTGSFGTSTKTTRNGRTSRRRSPVCWASCAVSDICNTNWKYLRDKYAKEAAKVAGTERSGCGISDVYKPKWIYFGSLRFLTVILVLKLLPRCWVDREAKGRRLLLNHLLARDVRQMADVVLINPHRGFDILHQPATCLELQLPMDNSGQSGPKRLPSQSCSLPGRARLPTWGCSFPAMTLLAADDRNLRPQTAARKAATNSALVKRGHSAMAATDLTLRRTKLARRPPAV